MHKTIFIAILSILLLGCSTNQLKPNADVPEGQGVIAIALTSTDLIGSYVVFGVSKDGKEIYDCMRNRGCYTDNTKDFLDIDGSIGNVVAYTYPPGKYYFSRWYIKQALYMNDRAWMPKNLTPVYFEVKENEVTYLGRFHTHIIKGKNLGGLDILLGGLIESRDDSEIAIPILYEKFPHLSKKKLNIDLLDVGVWNRDVLSNIKGQ